MKPMILSTRQGPILIVCHLFHRRCLSALNVCILLCVSLTGAAAADSRAELAEAVQQYQQAMETNDSLLSGERFRRAQALFQGVIERNPERASADLYANLGNAALQADDVGPAVLAFRQSLLIDPAHRRAQMNLIHARMSLPDWARYNAQGRETNSPVAWSSLANAGRMVPIAGWVFLATAACFALAIRSGRPLFRYLTTAGTLCWLLLMMPVVWENTWGARAVDGVVITDTVARSADSASAPSSLREPVPSGTEVAIAQFRPGWVQVRLPSAQLVWLPASSVATVSIGTASLETNPAGVDTSA